MDCPDRRLDGGDGGDGGDGDDGRDVFDCDSREPGKFCWDRRSEGTTSVPQC